MGYAMAKVAALLCIALLVAHADGARTLKDVTAETRAAEDSDIPQPVRDEVIPAPGAGGDYNYAAEDGSTDSTTLADEGFLVPPTPDSETTSEEFPGDDASTEDQGVDASVLAVEDPVEEPAQEAPEQEGTLWSSEDDNDRTDGATAESFADENTGGKLVDDSQDDAGSPKGYEYDATTEDAKYPEEGAGDSLAATFDTSNDVTDETTEPESGGFLFDDGNIDFGN